MSRGGSSAQTYLMGRPRTALVIGGGIIGVTSAYALARDGWRVQLVERNHDVALGASLGNGKQLSYSHTNALGSPKIIPQIPGLLLGLNDSFRLSLRPELRFVEWLLRFLINSTGPAYHRNTLQTLALAYESRRAMDRLLERHVIEFDRRKVGKLVLLRGKKEVQAARASMELKQKAGLRQNLLSAGEAAKIEPALEQSPDPLTAALYAPDDETGDCNLFASELAALISCEYDVQILTGCEAVSLERKAGDTRVRLDTGEILSADQVVIASGYCASQLLAPLGHNLPITPMKGYSFTAPIGNAPPQVSITDSKRRIVFTRAGDRLLVAGIAEIGRLNASVDPARLESMKRSARQSLPEAADYSKVDAGWAGFRPMTPNSQPIIRQLETGIAVNAGHGMLGWTLAMGSADRLSQAVAQH